MFTRALVMKSTIFTLDGISTHSLVVVFAARRTIPTSNFLTINSKIAVASNTTSTNKMNLVVFVIDRNIMAANV